MATPTTPDLTLPPEAHQFDFWIGEWNVTWEGGAGTNTICSIMDRRVIEEQFRSSDQSFQGMSVSVYSPQLSHWQQTWVDSQGSYIALSGGWDGERMVLTTERQGEGKIITLRMQFFDIRPEQLEWSWERSEDGGQSWALLWHIHYSRR